MCAASKVWVMAMHIASHAHSISAAASSHAAATVLAAQAVQVPGGRKGQAGGMLACADNRYFVVPEAICPEAVQASMCSASGSLVVRAALAGC